MNAPADRQKRPKRAHSGTPTSTRSLRLPLSVWQALDAAAAVQGVSSNAYAWAALESAIIADNGTATAR
jgi:predicted HicB family RNase H-like nuclease